jgi:hypothetical protein
MQDDDDISKLLRLKRFEQPSPEYFERFLEDFKERQRSQLLREPAWRIAWDRMCAFFGEQMPARVGYGLASTAVLAAAAIASFNILESRPADIVSVPDRHPAAQTSTLSLDTSVQLPGLPSIVPGTDPTASVSSPRYIMDARPVSYDSTRSF